MDPQQELFSTVLVALKEKYEDTGVGVYDTVLPPEDTPYPFVYLADCSESDQATKNEIIGETNLTLKVWHDNIRQRYMILCRYTLIRIESQKKIIFSRIERVERFQNLPLMNK